MDLSKKYKVKLECSGCNIVWASQGLISYDGTPAMCGWEDVHIHVLNDDGTDAMFYNLTLDSMFYIKGELEMLQGDFAAKMEIDYPGYIEENMNTGFGMRLDELVKHKDGYLYSYYYPTPGNDDQIENGFDLPRNEKGELPVDVVVLVPHESLTHENVIEAVKHFLGKFFHIETSEVFWFDDPDYDDAKKLADWNEHEEQAKEFAKMRAEGRTFRVVMVPGFLRDLYGSEHIDPLIARGLKEAEKVGGDTILTFEDGHTEILNIPDEELD